MLVEVDGTPGAGGEGTQPGVPVVSEAFLEDMRQDPVMSARLERVHQAIDRRRQMAGETAHIASSALMQAARLGGNVCAIAIHGDGLAAAREVVRSLRP